MANQNQHDDTNRQQGDDAGRRNPQHHQQQDRPGQQGDDANQRKPAREDNQRQR